MLRAMRRFIRQEHGDFFGISVAGYPEGHIDWYKDTPEISKEDYWKDMQVTNTSTPLFCFSLCIIRGSNLLLPQIFSVLLLACQISV